MSIYKHYQFWQVLITVHLTFTTLWANSAHDKLMLPFLLFQENRIWHFKQIASSEEHLLEMSDPIFWGNYENYFNMPSAHNFLVGWFGDLQPSQHFSGHIEPVSLPNHIFPGQSFKRLTSNSAHSFARN